MIKKLHHNAYRCRDSEQTRAFYEDFLGLPLAHAFHIDQTATGRATAALHTFFQLDDGSYLAFFAVPAQPFDFKRQHDFDLHIALEVERADLNAILSKARATQLEVRGIADHGIVESIYRRDTRAVPAELASQNARDCLETWKLGKQPLAP
jgi:catechol 2,3-dioxygenase-like lactoylglutathione lyase family enzyme